MMRGGFVAVQVATLLEGDAFPDLSLAAVGGWLRIRATSELTGEPVSSRVAERLGLTADVLAELVAAGVLEEVDGGHNAIGMPEPPRRPSETPEAWTERQRRHRATVTPLSGSPVNSDQLRSTQQSRSHAVSRVTRDTHGLSVDVHKYDGIVEGSADRCLVCGEKIVDLFAAIVVDAVGTMRHNVCPAATAPDKDEWIEATP